MCDRVWLSPLSMILGGSFDGTPLYFLTGFTGVTVVFCMPSTMLSIPWWPSCCGGRYC